MDYLNLIPFLEFMGGVAAAGHDLAVDLQRHPLAGQVHAFQELPGREAGGQFGGLAVDVEQHAGPGRRRGAGDFTAGPKRG